MAGKKDTLISFYVPQLVKSLSLNIPEAGERHPFQAGPPRVGQNREYSPTQTRAGHMVTSSGYDRSTYSIVIDAII